MQLSLERVLFYDYCNAELCTLASITVNWSTAATGNQFAQVSGHPLQPAETSHK